MRQKGIGAFRQADSAFHLEIAAMARSALLESSDDGCRQTNV